MLGSKGQNFFHVTSESFGLFVLSRLGELLIKDSVKSLGLGNVFSFKMQYFILDHKISVCTDQKS